MFSIFLLRNGEKEFYGAISDHTPTSIIRSTVKQISEKHDCTVFVRYITSTGNIEEWDNLTIP